MARKTKTLTIDAEGRDKGKTFQLTEMPAARAEDWAIRVLLALGSANVDLPPGAIQLGMAALAEIGLMKLFAISSEQVRPLLAELAECAVLIPNPQKPQVTVSYPMYETQVEEVKTLLTIKWEVLKLHLDFSLAASLSESVEKFRAAVGSKPSTRTSPKSSESLFPAA
jgi:hypothetical protein